MLPTTVGKATAGVLPNALFVVASICLVAACSRSTEPEAPVAAAFVGSATCAACHAPQSADWRGSHHELAMQAVSSDTVLGDFADAEFDYFGETTRFLTDDDGFVVQTPGQDGTRQEFRVAYVFGIEPLQQYLVEFPGGRLQSLPFAWDTRPNADGGQRWFHLYPDEHIAPGDLLHWTGRQQNWNFMCAECHSTNLEMGFDAAADTFATTYSEISVGCEACHGPGAVHVAQAGQGDFSSSHGLEVDLDDHGRATWIMNLQTGIAERSELALHVPQQPESCGQCHSRRASLSERYEFGKALVDTHMPSLLDETMYHADGQIQDEVYVYGSFLQSRMYRAGVTCSDCHNPHSLELKTGSDPNAVCETCHLPAKFNAVAHHGHAGAAPGCVDCHMPTTTYMGVDDRRDHGFRVPRPDLTITTAAPNACGNCHADKTPDWAASAISTWHGDGARERHQFATALAAGRRGYANPQLVASIVDTDTPGIARATALALLVAPFSPDDYRVMQGGLLDPDPLVRIAALRTLRYTPPDFRLQLGFQLLNDELRGVRIEAALAYADIQSQLSQGYRSAYSKAAAEYRRSLKFLASRPESHARLGGFAAAAGDLQQAAAHYERALAMEPRSVVARVNLSDVYRQLADDVRGEALFQEGLGLSPDNASLHHAYGLLLVRLQRSDEGLVELRQAAALAPANARYGYVLAVALNSLGQSDAAVELVRQLAAQHPNDPNIRALRESLRMD